jgi:hypothetical protein
MTNYRPTEQQYYKHVDGGLYFVSMIGKSTVDQSEHVIYIHIYPFELAPWIRPLEEWTTERFQLIDHVEASIMLKQDREAMKVAISQNKASRRAAEGRT